ncbi:MAG: hypothetical protein AAFQ23_12950, partial [Cyanobacteria bacterium J06623_1]
VRRKAQTKAHSSPHVMREIGGLRESSPNIDIAFEDKFCTVDKDIKCFILFNSHQAFDKN